MDINSNKISHIMLILDSKVTTLINGMHIL